MRSEDKTKDVIMVWVFAIGLAVAGFNLGRATNEPSNKKSCQESCQESGLESKLNKETQEVDLH